MRGSICIVAVAVAAVLAGCADDEARAKKKDLDLTRLELADDDVTTSAARRGRLYLCREQSGGGGAFRDGPWIQGDTWDYTAKATVDGSVEWPNAVFRQSVRGSTRTLTGNGLPTTHTTGAFPIAASDDAYQYDRNPNSIRSQSVSIQLPASPRRASSPQCIAGGQVGVLDSGVPLFSAVDAMGRDATAHEVQDRCDGHPQIQGTYHYHALPRCLSTGSSRAHSKRIGWALDGFPIYGPRGAGGEYMRNSRLDACHGHTHTVKVDGRKRSLYHYHATMEFPYTVGCFRGRQAARDQAGPPSLP